MNAIETLEVFSLAFSVVANLVVAGVCFKVFQAIRVAPLMLIAISASLAVFATIADIFLLQKTKEEFDYVFLWTGITMLWIVDIGLYALGVTRLVLWITTRTSGKDVTPDA